MFNSTNTLTRTLDRKHNSASLSSMSREGLLFTRRSDWLRAVRASQSIATTALQPVKTGVAATNIATTSAIFGDAATESQIAATGAARLKIGSTTLYIGTRQVTSNNQDPILSAYQNGKKLWSRTNFETTGADGRGYGLFWNGSALYGMFTIDGTQGNPDQDFRRFSTFNATEWTKSYGMGGGAKATVLVRLNPKNGAMKAASYLTSVLSSGQSNSLVISSMERAANGNLIINAKSYYAPRKVDGKAMTPGSNIGGSPFNQRFKMTPDLKQVVSSSAQGWSAMS